MESLPLANDWLKDYDPLFELLDEEMRLRSGAVTPSDFVFDPTLSHHFCDNPHIKQVDELSLILGLEWLPCLELDAELPIPSASSPASSSISSSSSSSSSSSATSTSAPASASSSVNNNTTYACPPVSIHRVPNVGQPTTNVNKSLDIQHQNNSISSSSNSVNTNHNNINNNHTRPIHRPAATLVQTTKQQLSYPNKTQLKLIAPTANSSVTNAGQFNPLQNSISTTATKTTIISAKHQLHNNQQAQHSHHHHHHHHHHQNASITGNAFPVTSSLNATYSSSSSTSSPSSKYSLSSSPLAANAFKRKRCHLGGRLKGAVGTSLLAPSPVAASSTEGSTNTNNFGAGVLVATTIANTTTASTTTTTPPPPNATSAATGHAARATLNQNDNNNIIILPVGGKSIATTGVNTTTKTSTSSGSNFFATKSAVNGDPQRSLKYFIHIEHAYSLTSLAAI